MQVHVYLESLANSNSQWEEPSNHPIIAGLPAIDADKEYFLDMHHRDRLGVLLSIDDIVSEVVKTLEELTPTLTLTLILGGEDSRGAKYHK